MKHFNDQQCVDFVNQASAPEQMTAMQEHLAGGCARCTDQVAFWEKVRQFASLEPMYRPPEPESQAAIAQFVSAPWMIASRLGKRSLELLFDSFLEPVDSGARDAGSSARQMLYRADSVQVDLQIEAVPSRGEIAMTGQVLDAGLPEIVGSGIQVSLSNGSGKVVHALTNEFGEFHLEIPNSGDLQLSLRGNSAKPIVICLGDPLTDSFERE